MLAEILEEALDKIEAIEQNQPDTYAVYASRLFFVKAVMRELQRELDLPPAIGERPDAPSAGEIIAQPLKGTRDQTTD